MTAKIQVGPSDDMQLPYQSLGEIFYHELRRKNQDRVILIDSTTYEKIDYRKLLKSSIKLATALTKIGVKKGDIVTIIAQNSWKYIVTVIAGFFIGGVVNLLNHDYTLEELKHLFKICQPNTIFCTKKNIHNIFQLKEELCLNPKNIIIYDAESCNNVKNFDNLLEEYDCEIFKPVQLDPKEEIALILTSSGTTGLPKCVMITHANFRITLINTGDPSLMDITEKETIIGYLPFFHVFGTLVFLTSVLNGTKFIIMSKFIPDKFLQIIQDYKVTKLFAVRPILLFLLQSPLIDKYDISSIQDVVAGSTVITKEFEEIVEKRLKIRSVRQAYGTTEVTGPATVVPKNSKKYGSMGKAARTFQIKVCDPDTGRILSPNQAGEIRILSPGIMKGYMGNEEETIASFDEDGFIKTGDLGYYDEDGFFFMTNRLKDIIKCKGFQVSPAELENVLVRHPAVKDAGVVGIPDERAGEVPLAFVVKEPNMNVTEDELVRFVEGNISIQKRLFGGVRFIEEIPKNPSGKILRRKLKDLL